MVEAHRRKLNVVPLFLLSFTAFGISDNSPDVLSAAVLDSFCANLIAEYGPIYEREITIPLETVPIIEIFALHILSTSDNLTADDFFADEKLSQELRESFKPIPIVPPKEASNCHWRTTRSIRKAQERNDLVLELSSPLKNPYASDPARNLGVFARLTSGIIGGTWYWITLEKTNGKWETVSVVRLDISEH